MFDHIPETSPEPCGRSWPAILFSAAVHIAVIGSLVGAPYIVIEAIALPELPVPLPGRPRDAMVQPRLVHRVHPRYPESARKSGLEGRVFLRAVITTSGRVLGAEVRRATDPVFVGPAVEAIRQWRYTPALAGGKPVEAPLTLIVDFRLAEAATIPRDPWYAPGGPASGHGYPYRTEERRVE